MQLGTAVRVLPRGAGRRAGLAEVAVVEPVLLEAEEPGVGGSCEVALLEPGNAGELLVWFALGHARRDCRLVVWGPVGVGAVAELVERTCLSAGGEE